MSKGEAKANHSGSSTPQGGISRRDFLAASKTTTAGLLLGVTQVEEAGESRRATSPSVSSSVGKRPKSMLAKNATVMVTMDSNRREIRDGGLYIEEGIIKQVGPTGSLPKTAEDVLDLKGCILCRGW